MFFYWPDLKKYMDSQNRPAVWEIPATQTKREFLRKNLTTEMRRHRGSKRLRKKKAVRTLTIQWVAHRMRSGISRRINYTQIGQRLFPVEPMPPASGLTLGPFDDDPTEEDPLPPMQA